MFWILLSLSAGYTVQGVRAEAHVRERELCGVVINVHNNAKFRADTEAQNLKATQDYLADPDSKKDSMALYKRVKENLPIVEGRVRDANANVHATTIPPICRKYIDSTKKT